MPPGPLIHRPVFSVAEDAHSPKIPWVLADMYRVRLDPTGFSGGAARLSEWSVGRKLGSVIATLALILLCVGVISTFLLWDASASLSQSAGQHLPVLQLSAAFEREILGARTEVVFQMTGQKPGAREAGLVHLRKARELASMLRAQVTASGSLTEFLAPTEQMILDLNDHELLLGRIFDAVRDQQNEGALFATLVQDWTRVDYRLADTAAALSREVGDQAESLSRRNAVRLDTSARTTAVACILAGILGSLLGLFLARDINRGLVLAAGELSTVADQFAEASNEIAGASNFLAEGATEQTCALRQVSASCREVDSMIRRGDDNAQSLALTLDESNRASESGMEALDRMSGAFDAIAASHGEVTRIVSIVDNLAFQTNLLAMKAAVEAIRSSETARTLAALADEAGDLAQRSAQSAKETAAAVELTAAAVAAGTGYAENAAGSLRIVAVETKRARGLSDEVSFESSRQKEGIGSIARAVAQIETVTKIVTTGADQTVAASLELSSRAATMKEIARGLTVLSGGAARQNGRAPARLAISARAFDESDHAQNEAPAVCMEA